MGRIPLCGKDACDAVDSAPEDRIAEVLAGELHTSPLPRVRHSRTASVLGVKLGGRFDDGGSGSGGWLFLFEPGLHLGVSPDIVVPDQAGWRCERMPKLPDTAAIELAPDWVCEVLSPSTERIDRGMKRAIYAREQVHHLWFVAPDAELLEVFALDRDTYRLLGTWSGDEAMRAPPFEALELALSDLWLR